MSLPLFAQITNLFGKNYEITSAYAATMLEITVQIVAKLAGQVGFVVLPRRWYGQFTVPAKQKTANRARQNLAYVQAVRKRGKAKGKRTRVAAAISRLPSARRGRQAQNVRLPKQGVDVLGAPFLAPGEREAGARFVLVQPFHYDIEHGDLRESRRKNTPVAPRLRVWSHTVRQSTIAIATTAIAFTRYAAIGRSTPAVNASATTIGYAGGWSVSS